MQGLSTGGTLADEGSSVASGASGRSARMAVAHHAAVRGGGARLRPPETQVAPGLRRWARSRDEHISATDRVPFNGRKIPTVSGPGTPFWTHRPARPELGRTRVSSFPTATLEVRCIRPAEPPADAGRGSLAGCRQEEIRMDRRVRPRAIPWVLLLVGSLILASCEIDDEVELWNLSGTVSDAAATRYPV